MVASAQATIQALELSTDDRFLACISIDHIGGKMMLVRAMELGARIKVLEPKIALETENPVDFIALVPLQVYGLLESSDGRDFLESCTKVIIGGAALKQWALDQLRPFSNHIYHTFGMTETISHIALKPISGNTDTPYYKTLPGIKIWSDERGCLTVNGPMTNHNTVTTNDMVELLDERHFRWLGRADQVINSGGFKIYPQKVEEAVKNLLQNEGIQAEFALLGLPHRKLGQMVILAVEATPWASNTRQAFLESLKTVLHPYEVPKKIMFLDNFPHTSSGKIDYTKLTEAISEG